MIRISLRKFQNLKKKKSLFYLELHSCVVSKAIHSTLQAESLLIWIFLDRLEDVYSSSFHIYDFWPIQLMTGRSERIPFVSRGESQQLWKLINSRLSCTTVMSPAVTFCYCVLCVLNYTQNNSVNYILSDRLEN